MVFKSYLKCVTRPRVNSHFRNYYFFYPECNLLKILFSVNKTLDQWNLIESKRLYIKAKYGVKWNKQDLFDSDNF